ncbi:MAG: hypothetical protein IH810_05275, partial [Proteobacteria bacterium]|nr:hypothetical protein [Pseudomonadota bacterium]
RIGIACAFECNTSLAGTIYVAFVIAAELETIEVIEFNDKFEPVLLLQQAADCRKHDLRGAETTENKIPDPMAPAELTEPSKKLLGFGQGWKRGNPDPLS